MSQSNNSNHSTSSSPSLKKRKTEHGEKPTALEPPPQQQQQQTPQAGPSPTPGSPHHAIPERDTSKPLCYRICLTGGPCAGKSTAMKEIADTIHERTGVRVFMVPEAATLLVNGGLKWDNMTEERIVAYQMELLKIQINLEDSFYAIAKACGHPSIVLCDRGTMDGRAYTPPELFDKMMKMGGWTIEELRDQRYDAVIHMVSAAIGAESFYTLDNNQARYEDLEGAQTADRHLRQMYVGHPCIKLIDNIPGQSFDEKVKRTVNVALEVIGQAIPKHCTRRFFVPNPPTEFPQKCETLQVRIFILKGSTTTLTRMLLTRTQGTSTVNIVQTTEEQPDGSRTVRRDTVSAKEASAVLEKERDMDHVEIIKKNLSFTVGEQFYDLAVYEKPEHFKGKAILYAEGLDSSKGLDDLPAWLSVESEVTNDRSFSNLHISRLRNDGDNGERK